MISRRKSALTRFRVGRVSVYLHHGAWWIYHRDGTKQVRRRIGGDHNEAEQVAAPINEQLAAGAPSLLAFSPIEIPELRQQFLNYHEHVLKSSMATIRRYRAAAQHLENFSSERTKVPQAHEVRPDAFACYLRV